jgi:hypothetical protein
VNRISTLVETTLNKLEPGDLFRKDFGDGERSLAILLRERTENTFLLGVIESRTFTTPLTWYSTNENSKCLSYGSDWTLEELHSGETVPGNTFQHREDAKLFIDGDGLILKFRPSQGLSHNTALFNLTGNVLKRDTLSTSASPVLRWRIWENRAAYDCQKEFIYEYEPKHNGND